MRAFSLVALMIVALASRAAAPDFVDLAQFDPASVWRCANSKITSRQENGETVWRWEISGGGEAFLWLADDLPIHNDVPTYQRFIYDVKVAEGEIDQLWPRTTGLIPHFPKLSGEWNRFYRTDPTKTWITYQQVFDDPTWNSSAMSAIPETIKLDRTKLLSFVCLPKGESCVVEFRRCRLVRDRVRVLKPYLTNPPGWPVGIMDTNGVRYTTPYFVKNVSSKATSVKPVVRSTHELFDVSIEPAAATIEPGATTQFNIIAKFVPRGGGGNSPLPEETAVVEFVPDGDDSLAYRTETFCTAPILDPRRVVDASPINAADADLQFWMNLSLADQKEIPGAVGQRVVYTVPYQCPKCKQGTMKVGPKWLDITCDHCGNVEHHTTMADTVWIATWSQIHQWGSSPLCLGRAYLATHDEKYAKQAIELLTLIAKHYDQLPWHNGGHPDGYDHAETGPEAWANGASARWGLTPSYGTDWMFQGLAMLHNMIVDSKSWTDESRAFVHQRLWIPVVTEIAKITPGISNMNDIINRDLMLIGFSTGDANILYRGTMYPTGIVGRMGDISPDGFSDEGSALNYHFSAMNEWLPSMKLLIASRMDWGPITDRALAALRMPLERTALSGQAYCTGNSGSAYYSVALDHPDFVLADQIFDAKQWPRDRKYSTEPKLWRDAGWAILRSGTKADQQIVVNLDFGRSHGHGDLDRMNLGLQAFGVPLSADPGSTYNYNQNASDGPAVKTMDSPFVSNSIIVDAKPQLRGGGKLITWQPNVKLPARSGRPAGPPSQFVVAEIDGIYPGVHWRRSVALIHGSVLVVDDLTSDQPHRYECAWHHLGDAKQNGAPMTSDFTQGEYARILNPRRLDAQQIRFDWRYQTARLRLWQDAPNHALAYTAQTGICWDNIRGLPIVGVYTRVEGRAAHFVSVLDPSRGTPRIKSLRSNADKITIDWIDGTSHTIRVRSDAKGDDSMTLEE
jgi:hypothetical protein